MKSDLILVVTGLLITSGAWASPPPSSFSFGSPGITLDQAVQEGKERSPQVQRAKAAMDESDWRKTEALGTGFLPHVSASASHFFTEKYEFTDLVFGGAPVSIPGIYPTTTLSLDATIPIFDGLSNIRRLEAASLMKEAAGNDYSRASFQLEQDIRLAFYQAVAATLLDDVSEQNVATLEDHLKQIQIIQRGGSATAYDVLRVQVQLNEARSDALDAKDNVTLARRKLSELLGLDQDERPLLGDLPIPNVDLIQTLKLENIPVERTDLRALELRAQASDKIEGARAAWLVPSVSLGGQYVFYNNLNNSISDTNSFRSAYNFGVFVRWNLFDGGVALAQSKQSMYQRIQAEKSNEQAKLQVPYEFDLWKRRYLSNTSRYFAKASDVQRSQESVRLAKEEQRAGTRTSSEVLDAELDLFRSKAGVVNAQSNSAEAKIRLELALGRKL